MTGTKVRDILKLIAKKNAADDYKRQLSDRKTEIVKLGQLPAQLARLKSLRDQKSSD